MIVLCEGCERRFQLDDSRIPDTGARVRCKYCQHRFRVPPPGEPSNEAPSPSASADTARAKSDSPTEISAEDTLFGTAEGQGVGAPIDGDRSLFGTIEDTPDAPQVDEFGPTEPDEEADAPPDSLSFVSDPPLEWADEVAEPIEARASAEPNDAPEGTASEAEVAAPEAEAALPDSQTDSPEGQPAEAPAEEEPEPRTDPSPAGDDAAGEGSWEFVESNLSFDEASQEPTEVEPELPPDAPLAVESEGDETADPADTLEEDTLEGMEVDLGASHPGGAAGVVDETPSMRAVEPGPGADALMFEMVEGDDAGEPLELAIEDGADTGSEVAETELPAEADAPDDAPAPVEAAASEPEAEPEPPPAEIGTVDDWDRLADEDDAPLPLPSEPEPTADEPAEAEANDLAPELEPDAPSLPDDLPEALPPAARRGNAWLEHAGWALSLVLLLAVAQGTIHIEPAAIEAPPGLVEIEGLQAENVRGRFVENARSGTLFVVSGELRNRSRAARAGGPLRVVVLDEHGFAFEGRGAAVGRTLSEAMVRETPIGALQQQQAALARTLGEQALAPGEGVSFQAILGELPDGAVRFRLERAELPARKAGPELPGGSPEAAREPDAPEV
ncbi:MAG: zinc-ribbon domain-containing protein [Deltaproteobacteria bacterium]|nr:zinc-ribbon domain-containing protein [Deltaproteobacteria bacterium]MBW2445712.1 zinc-ribbon domain-containing protein [Deltaproteobacteria bacterium]